MNSYRKNKLKFLKKIQYEGTQPALELYGYAGDDDLKTIDVPDDDDEPEKLKPTITSDLDKGFNVDEIQRLTQYQLRPPSQVLQALSDESLDIKDYDKKLGQKIKDLGIKKGQLSNTKRKKN